MPHVAKYSEDLIFSGRHTICRCVGPPAYSDAFTWRHYAEAVNYITFHSPTGGPLTWE